jgi:signal transduction histidine kinase
MGVSSAPVQRGGLRRNGPEVSVRSILRRLDAEGLVVSPRQLTRWDVALALVTWVALIFGPWIVAGDEPDLLGLVTATTMAAAVAARRIWPVSALVVITAADMAWVTTGHGEFAVVVMMGVLVTVGNRRPPSVSIPLTLVVMAVVFVSAVVSSDLPTASSENLLILGWFLAATVAGFVMRSRRAELAAVLEREAARRERRVDEERLRIARELHDTVGHSMAALGMQAGVAARVIDRHPQQAREALDNIAELSRSTLQEIRDTLGLLRSTEEEDERSDGASDRSPHYSVDRLIDVLRARGISVSNERWGEDSHVPTHLQPVVYRIVQEAVTNILRHARGVTEVQVTTELAPGMMVLAIVNDGEPVEAQHPAQNGGHGITGMRERAASVGGTVTADPRPGGGFDVRAVLPLDDGDDAGRGIDG